MSDPYRRFRTFHKNVSGILRILPATDTTTLITAGATETIYLQKLHVEVTALQAVTTWTFQTSATVPVLLVPVLDASAIAHFDFDFGPKGIPIYTMAYSFDYDGEGGTPPFILLETLTFSGGGTAKLLVKTADNASTGTLTVTMLSGNVSVNNETFSGGTSGATAVVNGSVVRVADPSQLADGKNFIFKPSSTGAAGWVSWEAYAQRTVVAAA